MYCIRRVLFYPIITAAFLLSGCSSPRAVDYDQVSDQERLIIRFPYVTGENTPKGLAAKKFKELIEKRSNGKIEVQVFPNSSLYSDYKEIEQLQKGNVQMIAPHTAKFSEILPEAQLLDLPYLFNNHEEVGELAEGPVGAEISRLLEKKGFKLLAVWNNGFKQLTNNQKPIQTPEDLFGLVFRIAHSEVIKEQFELAGAKSIVLPFNELYGALEAGKVQGEENTVSNINNKRLYTHQEYMTKSDHGYLGYFVITTNQFWSSLPKDTKTMLEETIDEVTEWERQTAAKMEEEQYLQLKQQEDLSIYELSPKEKTEWRNTFHSTYQWFTNKIDNKVIEEYIKTK
ncbi:DctP family TRAP transporter solute-binding subunit [Ectobacillus funiculus]|uniref:DctP family TRAP transporter solute-binding subunit n=1 Tax=Ectobacillus funiculus TaxID=137993 RepID=UPI0036D39F5A